MVLLPASRGTEGPGGTGTSHGAGEMRFATDWPPGSPCRDARATLAPIEPPSVLPGTSVPSSQSSRLASQSSILVRHLKNTAECLSLGSSKPSVLVESAALSPARLRRGHASVPAVLSARALPLTDLGMC